MFIINNSAHETVGGLPIVCGKIDLLSIARAYGYKTAVSVDNFATLDRALEMAKKNDELMFIEVKCALGARDDLGRPTTTAIENKQNFMGYLHAL